MAVKNLRNLLRQCKGKLDQKIELSGVMVTGNKLIATDTDRILILEFKESFGEAILFEDLPPSIKADSPDDVVTILTANNNFLSDLGFRVCKIDIFEQYDVEPIIEKALSEFSPIKRMKNTYSDIVFCECVKLNGSSFQMKYLYKFLQLVDRAEIAQLKISQKAQDLPLVITGKNQDKEILLEKMTYILMPMREV